jgi:hypothetical protein
VFAAQIIAVSDVKVANRLKVFKVEMEREVEEKALRLVAISSISAPVRMSAPVKVSVPVKVSAPAKMAAQAVKAEPLVEIAPAKKKPRRRRWKKKPVRAGATQEPTE